MSEPNIHVVFGTGPLGNAVMEQLLLRGKRVRMVNRSGVFHIPAGVEGVRGDARDLARTREICKDAAVIYHCMGLPYPEWKEQMPTMMKGIIGGAAESGAVIVYGDNLYAYGPVNGMIHENISYHPVGTKTGVRAEVATMLMDAHRSGTIRAAIGRGPDFFGPGALVASLGAGVFENMLKDKPVELIGKPDVIHSYIFLRDFAVGLVTLGQQETAWGEIWHLPSAGPISTRQWIDMIAQQAGKKVKFRIANRAIVNLIGLFHPAMREFKEVLYQFERPFVVDHSKYERSFGADITPHSESVRQTLDWFMSRATS